MFQVAFIELNNLLSFKLKMSIFSFFLIEVKTFLTIPTVIEPLVLRGLK